MGQYLFKKHGIYIKKAGEKHDIRINACIIAPSGTGKSEANNFLGTMATNIGLSYNIPHIYNDVSVIGSYSFEIEQRNKDKKLTPDDERWINPARYGLLKTCDLAIFDEGENVLRTSGKTEWIQLTLQKVANRYGSPANYIENLKIGGAIGYHSSASFVITSYPLSEFKETLLRKGLIQRSILFIDENDEEKRNKILNKQIQMLGAEYSSRKLVFNDFMKELKLIDGFLEKEKVNTVFFSEKAKLKIDEYQKEIRKMIVLTPGQQDIFNDIESRLINQFAILGAINAVVRKGTVIEKKDIEEAYLLLWKTTLSSIKYIQENVEFEIDKKYDKYLKNLYEVLDKKVYTKGEIYDKMAKKWNVGKNTAMSRIKKLERYFEKVESSNKNTKLLRLKI